MSRSSPRGSPPSPSATAIYDYRLNRALDRLSQSQCAGRDRSRRQRRRADRHPAAGESESAATARRQAAVRGHGPQSADRLGVARLRAAQLGVLLRRSGGSIPCSRKGKPLPIELIAVRTDGKPLDAPVRATVRLTRINWQTNRLATAGDTTRVREQSRARRSSGSASSRPLRAWAKTASRAIAQLEQAVAGQARRVSARGRSAKTRAAMTSSRPPSSTSPARSRRSGITAIHT